MASRDLPVSWEMAAIFGSITVINFGLLLRFLTGVRAETSLFAVLRRSYETEKRGDEPAGSDSA